MVNLQRLHGFMNEDSMATAPSRTSRAFVPPCNLALKAPVQGRLLSDQTREPEPVQVITPEP